MIAWIWCTCWMLLVHNEFGKKIEFLKIWAKQGLNMMNKIKIPSSIKLKIKKKGTSSLSHTPSPTSITFWKSPKRNKEQIISKFTTLKWTPIWKSYCFTCKEKKVLRSLNFTLHAWVTIWLYIFKYLFIAWNTETNYVLGAKFCYKTWLWGSVDNNK